MSKFPGTQEDHNRIVRRLRKEIAEAEHDRHAMAAQLHVATLELAKEQAKNANLWAAVESAGLAPLAE